MMEFKILREIGMTMKQKTQMIRMECMYTTLRSLIPGIVLGLLFAYLMIPGHWIIEESLLLLYSFE